MLEYHLITVSFDRVGNVVQFRNFVYTSVCQNGSIKSVSSGSGNMEVEGSMKFTFYTVQDFIAVRYVRLV